MATLDATQFVERILRGKPIPAALLLGGDLYLRDLCRSRLIETVVPIGSREWGVSRFSAAEDDLDHIVAQLQTPSMLSPRQVVILQDIEAWQGREEDEPSSGRESRRSPIWQPLAAYLDNPAPFSCLLLEAATLDRRTKLYKTLSEKTMVVSVALGETPEQRIPLAAALVPQMAADLGFTIDEEAAAGLSDLLDGDLSGMRSELEKLAAYVADRNNISSKDVDALVISAKKYSVWQLADMLAERRRSPALTFLESLFREGEQPPAIVGALAWMYRKLIEAQELSPRTSPGQASGYLRMRQSAAAIALEQSRKIPRRQLLDGLVALYEADSRLKSGPPDPRAVLEILLARLISPSPA